MTGEMPWSCCLLGKMSLGRLSRGELSLATTIFTSTSFGPFASCPVLFYNNLYLYWNPDARPPLLCPGEDDQPVKMLVLAYLPALQCNYILRLL